MAPIEAAASISAAVSTCSHHGGDPVSLLDAHGAESLLQAGDGVAQPVP
jgi:hypothetical protein